MGIDSCPTAYFFALKPESAEIGNLSLLKNKRRRLELMNVTVEG